MIEHRNLSLIRWLVSPVLFLTTFSLCSTVVAQMTPTVIAHRGACGYLPEHTLEAVALAIGMQADFVEQDVVLTNDSVPIVLHDIHLDTVTEVATRFPNRSRADGRFYAIDFSLEEIRQLSIHERVDHETGKQVYSGRFAKAKPAFKVATLAESIELIQGINASAGRKVGIYVEIKSPAWHRQQNHDISKVVLDLLKRFGYASKDDNAFVQCFDAEELRRIRESFESKLKLVQLIGENDWNEAPVDFDQMRTREGIKSIAEYANGIGPWMPHILSPVEGKPPKQTKLVAWAHEAGLLVHPYTFRKDALPEYAQSFDDLLEKFIATGIDGLFTDFPDLAIAYRSSRQIKLQRRDSRE